jgi:hypothetical protein
LKIKKIEIENVNHPRRLKLGDADMYEAMKRAFLKILPNKPPGLTETEIRERVVVHLPEQLFPEGVLRRVGGRRPFSLIWRRKVLLRERKPSHSAGARHNPCPKRVAQGIHARVGPSKSWIGRRAIPSCLGPR